MGGKNYFQSYKTDQQHWVQLQILIPDKDRALCKQIQLLNQPNSLRFLPKGSRASSAVPILTAMTESVKLFLTRALRDFSVFTITGNPRTA